MEHFYILCHKSKSCTVDEENKVITNDSGVASSTLELKILLLR